MSAYDRLDPFFDVVTALKALRGSDEIECVVFSNGTRKMINNSVRESPGLSPISEVFTKFISVDLLQSYKPAPEAYRYLLNCVDMSGKEADVWLISCNAFDVVGGQMIGMKTVWVDRVGDGWQDQLGPEPSKVIRRLGELVQLVNNAP